MVCEHLAALEKELLASGAEVTYRGQSWSKNCREWVYFEVRLDADSLMKRFSFDPCVQVHENKDSKSGLEHSLYCSKCHDGVMGNVSAKGIYR
jgi:hypothetical protein